MSLVRASHPQTVLINKKTEDAIIAAVGRMRVKIHTIPQENSDHSRIGWSSKKLWN
jgi:hypothetical protein